YSDFFGGKFFINLTGREPTGCVPPEEYEAVREALIAKLRMLRDPETGGKLVSEIWKKEELFSGPALEDAPDVVCLETPGYLFTRLGRGRGSELLCDPPGEFFSGFHRIEGILMARGPGIVQGGRLASANIIDFTPTVLHAMDEPRLAAMDGKALKELFIGDVADRVSDEIVEMQGMSPKPGHDVEEVDVEELERQLRSLGYVR
ncbi:hypothetical protein JW905_11265, partial [bacterium]|nr:hypothetical protein [candidate division CSSED10-310 bacterium]